MHDPFFSEQTSSSHCERIAVSNLEGRPPTLPPALKIKGNTDRDAAGAELPAEDAGQGARRAGGQPEPQPPQRADDGVAEGAPSPRRQGDGDQRSSPNEGKILFIRRAGGGAVTSGIRPCVYAGQEDTAADRRVFCLSPSLAFDLLAERMRRRHVLVVQHIGQRGGVGGDQKKAATHTNSTPRERGTDERRQDHNIH